MYYNSSQIISQIILHKSQQQDKMDTIPDALSTLAADVADVRDAYSPSSGGSDSESDSDSNGEHFYICPLLIYITDR